VAVDRPALPGLPRLIWQARNPARGRGVVSPVMYRSQGRPGALAVSAPSLLAQVLGITGAGFLITAAAAYYFQGVSYGLSLIAMLVGFGFLIAINATRANEALGLLFFYLFTLCEGVGIAPVIGSYVRTVGPEVVVQAATTTGLGMLTLACVSFMTSIDFRRFQGIAFFALLGLVLVGIVSLFVRFIHPEVYAWATLAIFTLLVLIDFSRVRAGGDGMNAVQLATSIYLDAINIFLALLQIFGGRRRD
jgi:FtsH-binding integral membrane protein